MRSPPAADANEMPAPPSSGVPKPWAFKKDSRRLSLKTNTMSQTRPPAGVDGCEVGIIIWNKILGPTAQASSRTRKGKGAQQGQRSVCLSVPKSAVRIWASSKGFRNGQQRDTWRSVEQIPHPHVAQRALTWLGWRRYYHKVAQECRSEMRASLMMPDAIGCLIIWR